MNKPTTAQNVLLIISVTIAALVLVWFIAKDSKYDTENEDNGDPTAALSLYYRDDCPHCKIVEQYLLDNKVEEKIQIEHKEIMNNIENNNEIMVRAANCNLDLETVGVPLLYDKGTCYVGDQEIINYFQSRL